MAIGVCSIFNLGETPSSLSGLFREMRCKQKQMDARRESQAMVIPLSRFVTPQTLFLFATLRDGVIFTYCCVASCLFGITKRRFTAPCTTKKSSPSHS